jgi:adenylate cyclase class IV
MAFEIELKVRLDNFKPVKERLSALGNFCRSYEKSDSYWLGENASAGVRVRKDACGRRDACACDQGESVLVTYKKKEISGGMEVNEEKEFTVSDAGLFVEMLERLGLHMVMQKEKKGWAWLIPSETAGGSSVADGGPVTDDGSVLAELSLVKGLGWFLELEIMAADNEEHTVEESRKRLFFLLEKLEIPACKIEPRPYAALLSAAAQPSCGAT